MTTRFHRATESLLADCGRAFARGGGTSAAVRWDVPPAVAEWYSFENAIDLLHEFSNCDHPLPLANWPEVPDDEHGEGAPVRVFMCENQHVCEWAVVLDGRDDPPVLVNVDGDGWVPCADRFSTFIYCGVFDHPPDWLCVSTQTGPLPDRVRHRLGSTFEPGPVTLGWPGEISRRYGRPGVRITIWETGHPDWWFRARTAADLDRLLADVSDNRLADLGPAIAGRGEAEGVLAVWRRRVSWPAR